ncbi:helix-turn-helix transcriptional regulator [Chitinimonas sp. PSY-7]|uniref:autoinducer binding domain-containing protein n=1 Tax=Chitinimonas sp. PSY-7 TaxID=3459088 RepID=UPI00403FE3A8
MIEELYSGLLSVKEEGALLAELSKLSQLLGFDYFDICVVADQPSGKPIERGLAHYPQAWLEEAWTNQKFLAKDPKAIGRRERIQPVAWDTAYYQREGAGELGEILAGAGLKSGIEVGARSQNGRVRLYVEAVRDRELLAPAELGMACAQLQLFANMALPPASQLWLPPPETVSQALTARELECLRWTMEGKTAWEVGQIIGVTERTAVFHLQNAVHKLDCANKHQAVIKALRLQLIY